jgi:DNA-directed RNA polymerase subunit beta'
MTLHKTISLKKNKKSFCLFVSTFFMQKPYNRFSYLYCFSYNEKELISEELSLSEALSEAFLVFSKKSYHSLKSKNFSFYGKLKKILVSESSSSLSSSIFDSLLKQSKKKKIKLRIKKNFNLLQKQNLIEANKSMQNSFVKGSLFQKRSSVFKTNKSQEINQNLSLKKIQVLSKKERNKDNLVFLKSGYMSSVSPFQTKIKNKLTFDYNNNENEIHISKFPIYFTRPTNSPSYVVKSPEKVRTPLMVSLRKGGGHRAPSSLLRALDPIAPCRVKKVLTPRKSRTLTGWLSPLVPYLCLRIPFPYRDKESTKSLWDSKASLSPFGARAHPRRGREWALVQIGEGGVQRTLFSAIAPIGVESITRRSFLKNNGGLATLKSDFVGSFLSEDRERAKDWPTLINRSNLNKRKEIAIPLVGFVSNPFTGQERFRIGRQRPYLSPLGALALKRAKALPLQRWEVEDQKEASSLCPIKVLTTFPVGHRGVLPVSFPLSGSLPLVGQEPIPVLILRSLPLSGQEPYRIAKVEEDGLLPQKGKGTQKQSEGTTGVQWPPLHKASAVPNGKAQIRKERNLLKGVLAPIEAITQEKIAKRGFLPYKGQEFKKTCFHSLESVSSKLKLNEQKKASSNYTYELTVKINPDNLKKDSLANPFSSPQGNGVGKIWNKQSLVPQKDFNLSSLRKGLDGRPLSLRTSSRGIDNGKNCLQSEEQILIKKKKFTSPFAQVSSFWSKLQQKEKNGKIPITHLIPLKNSYSKLSEIQFITIALASSEKIRQWAEKTLPNGKILGQITNPNTLHHKTFKPIKGGLFCDRIFGPLQDFQCACGTKKKPQSKDLSKLQISLNSLSQKTDIHKPLRFNPRKFINKGRLLKKLDTPSLSKRTFCSVCDVEYTFAVVRRYQLGYIQLASPVTHVWYLKANPSYLSMLFDMNKKDLESVIYCSKTMTLELSFKGINNLRFDGSTSTLFNFWKKLISPSDKETSTLIKFENKKTKHLFGKRVFFRNHYLIQTNSSYFLKKKKLPVLPFVPNKKGLPPSVGYAIPLGSCSSQINNPLFSYWSSYPVKGKRPSNSNQAKNPFSHFWGYYPAFSSMASYRDRGYYPFWGKNPDKGKGQKNLNPSRNNLFLKFIFDLQLNFVPIQIQNCLMLKFLLYIIKTKPTNFAPYWGSYSTKGSLFTFGLRRGYCPKRGYYPINPYRGTLTRGPYSLRTEKGSLTKKIEIPYNSIEKFIFIIINRLKYYIFGSSCFSCNSWTDPIFIKENKKIEIQNISNGILKTLNEKKFQILFDLQFFKSLTEKKTKKILGKLFVHFKNTISRKLPICSYIFFKIEQIIQKKFINSQFFDIAAGFQSPILNSSQFFVNKSKGVSSFFAWEGEDVAARVKGSDPYLLRLSFKPLITDQIKFLQNKNKKNTHQVGYQNIWKFFYKISYKKAFYAFQKKQNSFFSKIDSMKFFSEFSSLKKFSSSPQSLKGYFLYSILVMKTAVFEIKQFFKKLFFYFSLKSTRYNLNSIFNWQFQSIVDEPSLGVLSLLGFDEPARKELSLIRVLTPKGAIAHSGQLNLYQGSYPNRGKSPLFIPFLYEDGHVLRTYLTGPSRRQKTNKIIAASQESSYIVFVKQKQKLKTLKNHYYIVQNFLNIVSKKYSIFRYLFSKINPVEALIPNVKKKDKVTNNFISHLNALQILIVFKRKFKQIEQRIGKITNLKNKADGNHHLTEFLVKHLKFKKINKINNCNSKVIFKFSKFLVEKNLFKNCELKKKINKKINLFCFDFVNKTKLFTKIASNKIIFPFLLNKLIEKSKFFRFNCFLLLESYSEKAFKPYTFCPQFFLKTGFDPFLSSERKDQTKSYPASQSKVILINPPQGSYNDWGSRAAPGHRGGCPPDKGSRRLSLPIRDATPSMAGGGHRAFFPVPSSSFANAPKWKRGSVGNVKGSRGHGKSPTNRQALLQTKVGRGTFYKDYKIQQELPTLEENLFAKNLKLIEFLDLELNKSHRAKPSSYYFQNTNFLSFIALKVPKQKTKLDQSQYARLLKIQKLKNEKSRILKKIHLKNVGIFTNNIYTLSHRRLWETEKESQNLILYLFTGAEPSDTIIPIYNNRLKTDSLNIFGAGIIHKLLLEFDVNEQKKIDKQNRILLYQLNKKIERLKNKFYIPFAKQRFKDLCKKRDTLIRRTKLIRILARSGSVPLSLSYQSTKKSQAESIVLTNLPVLPPDLRPILKISGEVAASDLNRLYQRVVYRNDRLKKFLKHFGSSHSYEMKYAQRLLQEAVDNLIQNGKSGVVAETDSRGRPLKSLSDILKGKQGRFRQYLLGKRVDYSGRSVIVVGPKLELHECGLPKEMAVELYLPFLIKRLLKENYVKTVIGAKLLIKNNKPLIWQFLREIMETCPVLLNRAPTLHRLGFQSFQPKLVEGKAILLHPLVCPAFNADFDGDQMAVHVPLTMQARTEAWKLMLSRNNLLSPATGEPIVLPSQDMVLGCYYLTTNCNDSVIKNQRGTNKYFNKFDNVLKAYNQNLLDIHAVVWVKWNGFIESNNDSEEPLEIRIISNGQKQIIFMTSFITFNFSNESINQYIRTTPGKILFNTILQKALSKGE